MSFFMLGMGSATPANAMSQAEATELAHQVICRDDQQRRLLTVLYRKAGVENRYTALPHRVALEWLPAMASGEAEAKVAALGPTTAERMRFFAEHAPPLAQSAAEDALADAQAQREEITHLVTVSCTGFDAPNVDAALITRLGLQPTTQRVHVGFMGCHGAINALRVARALTTDDPAARVLLCAVELCSLHYRFKWDPDRIVANAIFSDGAAAVVGGGQSSVARDAWAIQDTASCLLPDSLDAMSWKIGDHGFEMTLSARVPELIRQHLRTWLGQWLQEQGHSVETIRSWAIHPGGPRILDSVQESLGLPREATAASREILAHYGNMSSPTVLFILDRLRQLNAPRPCVALGFGPGLFAEAALAV